jgi:3-phosphoshikimate 1-carboxyvinyltransferase
VSSDVAEIEPGRPLIGRIRVPGDKSVSHRALLLAGQASGTSVLQGLADGDDVHRTAVAMSSVGAVLSGDWTALSVTSGPALLHEPVAPIDVGNSGTGIRLLAGWLASFPWFSVLHGDSSIAMRPMDRIAAPLRQMGARIEGRDGGRLPPLAITGGSLDGIDYMLPVASAQVKGAVLLAGLGAAGVTTVREPAPIRAHTEELLALAGASVSVSDDGAVVSVSRSALRPFELTIPGDPSQAAFWVIAGCVVPGSDVTVEGVYVGRARAGFLDVLRRMGADLTVTMTDPTTASIRARSSALVATEVAGEEVAGLIDEIPVLAVAAAFASGETVFRDAAELAVKESDRIATTTAALRAFGVAVEPTPDGLVVRGGGALAGAAVDAHGDHRIAMASAVAALAAGGPSTVRGWGAVATSYPSFLADLSRLRS